MRWGLSNIVKKWVINERREMGKKEEEKKNKKKFI